MPRVWCRQRCAMCLQHGCLSVCLGKCFSFDNGLSAKECQRAATYFQYSKHIVDRTKRWPLHSFLCEISYFFSVQSISGIIPRICRWIQDRDCSIKRVAYKCVTLYWCLFLLDFTYSIYHIYIYDTHDDIIRWPLQDNSNFEMSMQFIYISYLYVIWLPCGLEYGWLCFISFVWYTNIMLKTKRSYNCHTQTFFSDWNTLRWRHNELDGVSEHQPHDCLLSRLFGRRSKETPKLRVTGLCAGNSPGTGEFPAQMASNAEMFPFDDVIMIFVAVIAKLVIWLVCSTSVFHCYILSSIPVVI